MRREILKTANNTKAYTYKYKKEYIHIHIQLHTLPERYLSSTL